MRKAASCNGKPWINQMPLGQLVSEATAQKIELEGTRLTCKKNQEIITRFSDHDHVFLLVEGSVRVLVYSANGKAVNFRKVEAGEVFGEFAAIDGLHRSASVEAVEPCRIISISAPLFQELLESDSGFMRYVMKQFVTLIRSLSSRIVEFSTLSVPSRIHTELLRLARNGTARKSVYEISPAPTHLEIAGRISTHREAVSREISRLKAMGIIERNGRSLIIKDKTGLEQMVENASGEQAD